MVLAAAAIVTLWACQPLPESSPVRDDERVILFPALASPEAGGAWRVEVRGWIFEPEADSWRRGALLKGLRESLGLEAGAEDSAILKDRARAFLVDNERDKRISLAIGSRPFVSEPSRENGHFAATFSLGEGARRGHDAVRVALGDDDKRTFEAPIMYLEATGLSVVSDIDDTIKVSNIGDKDALLRATFLEPFKPVDGMSKLYAQLAERRAAFHYVSASPWQLYEPLAAFLRDSGFPAGSMHLKEFRVKDSSFLALFEEPEKTKAPVIESLIRRWPQRHFVLVGDDSENDAAIYASLARRFPEQVVLILIRLSPGTPAGSQERTAAALRDVPADRWQAFTDAAEVRVPEQLK